MLSLYEKKQKVITFQPSSIAGYLEILQRLPMIKWDSDNIGFVISLYTRGPTMDLTTDDSLPDVKKKVQDDLPVK